MTASTAKASLTASQQPRLAAASGFLGSLVEYYDFFIFASASALVFPTLMFPKGDPTAATLASLSTFAVGYVARPLGALVLGHFGDKIGRKKVLVLSLMMMGVGTLLIGCLPSYDTVGIWAPVALVALRLLQGFSTGGEQSGANSLSLEHSPDGRRGFFTSWTGNGTQAGQLVATTAFIPIAALPHDALFSWGWRIPFFASAIVVLIALIIRSRLNETPVFHSLESDHAVSKYPVVDVFRHEWKSLLRVIGCYMYSMAGPIITVSALAYANGTSKDVVGQVLAAAAVANILQMVCIPFWAILSDRIGRKPVFFIALAATAITFFGLLHAISARSVLLIFAVNVFYGIFGSGKNAITSFFAEMFPARVRYSGSAIASNIGIALTGFAPAIGLSIMGKGPEGWVPLAAMGAFFMLVAAVAAGTSRETAKITLTDLDAPTRAAANAQKG